VSRAGGRRASGKAIPIDLSAIAHWAELLGGQKYLAELIGRNPSRINQIKNAEAAPVDLIEELSVEIAKLIRGERTRLQLRRPELRLAEQPTADRIFDNLIGKLPFSQLMRPDWPFEGRKRELSLFDEALAGARRSEGKAIAVSGARGSGKSSLLRLCLRVAERSGVRAWIACGAAASSSVPYGPWIRILTQWLREGPPPMPASVGAGARTLVGVLTSLQRRWPALRSASRLETADAPQLHELVWCALQELSQISPLLLVLDDLHLADASTRELWSYCVDELAVGESRIVLLASYTAHAGPCAGPTTSARIQRWDLHGLSPRDTSALLLHRFSPATSTEAAGLYSLTHGHPSLIRELVEAPEGLSAIPRLLSPEGATQPLAAKVEELLAGFLVGLPESSLRALQAAAVLGDHFRPQHLAAMCAGPVDLTRLVERPLIQRVHATPGSYEFAPGLLRHYIYARIEPARLAALHRIAADALRDARSPSVSAGELAHHLLRAGGDCCEEGVRCAVRAAEEAYGRMAYDEAARQYRQALAVLDPQEPLACTLSVQLARAQNRAGNIVEANTTLFETALRARTLAANEVVCRAALELGAQTPYIVSTTRAPTGLLQEAMAEAGNDDALRAKLAARLSAMSAISDPARAAELAAESLQLTRDLQNRDPETCVYAREATYIALLRPDHAPNIRAAEELCALAEQTRQLDLILRARRALVDTTMRTARSSDEMRRTLLSYTGLSALSKQPECHLWGNILEACLRLLNGQLEEAEKLSVEAYERGSAAGDENAALLRLGQRLALLFYRRDWNALEHELGPNSSRMNEIPDGVLRLFLDAKRGKQAQARHRLDEIAANGFRELQRPIVWPMQIWLVCEALRHLETAEHADAIRQILAPRLDDNLVLGLGVAHLGPATRCMGLLAEVCGEREQALAFLEQALLRARELAAEPWVAITEIDLGRVLMVSRSRQDRERAQCLLRSAALRAERLALPHLERECQVTAGQGTRWDACRTADSR